MVADVLLTALGHAWRTLEASGAKLAVMGGIALASWKYVRATRDVDLLIGSEGKSIDDLLAPLRAGGILPRRQPPVTTLGRLRLVQCVYTPPQSFLDLQIDLLLAECPYQLQALDRRVPERLSGLDLQVYVLACEDLILHKLLAGRIIDRVDCASLIRLQRDHLDRAYLRQWAKYLAQTEGLDMVWREAFPGEPLPR
ncbi:MAG TPA: nucleotidyl transferase AbiEii/AbiGii toxin family protein [Pirellulales bacterium]|nr:nucleotidyl transferase AbiEii/AbiGii toxin family protein [Pirellulales bacterium]